MATTSSPRSWKLVKTQGPGLDHGMAELDGGPSGPNTSCGRRRRDVPEAHSELVVSWPSFLQLLRSRVTVQSQAVAWSPSSLLDLNTDSSGFAHFAFRSSPAKERRSWPFILTGGNCEASIIPAQPGKLLGALGDSLLLPHLGTCSVSLLCAQTRARGSRAGSGVEEGPVLGCRLGSQNVLGKCNRDPHNSVCALCSHVLQGF